MRIRALVLLACLLAGLAAPGGAAAQCIAHKFTSGKPDGVDASLIRPSNWNACHNVTGGTHGQVMQRDTGATDGWSFTDQPNIFGPSYMTLTNKTGVTLAVNDVVAIATGDDSAATLGDTLNSLQTFVVAAESISNNVAGKFYHRGLVTVKVQGAVTRGRYLVKSATTLAAEDSGTLSSSTNAAPAGAFAIATTAAAGPGAGTVTAVLLGATLPQTAAASLPGASYFEAQEAAAPSTPSADRVRLYAPTTTATTRWQAKDAQGQTLDLAGVLYREAGNPIKDITNTTTETSVFSSAPTIKGNTLGTDRVLRVTVLADFLNNAATLNVTFRVKYGATTLIAWSGVSNTTSATRRAGRLVVELGAANATNAQFAQIVGETRQQHVDTVGSTGTATEDSTADKTLDVTVQWDAASTTRSYRPFLILVELL